MVNFVGIAGGSGSGKSTLAYGLQDRFPEFIEIVHFDDYQKPIEEIPLHKGIKNWDHPDSIYFDRLLEDLVSLKQGKKVEIMTKSERHNPEYTKEWKRVPHTLIAKDLVIVEGYMALTDERIRKMFDLTVFLHLSDEKRLARRTKFVSSDYTTNILLPMHREFVEPCREIADIVLETEENDISRVQEITIGHLRAKKLL